MCTIADDGIHLVIADGQSGYEFNLNTNTFKMIDDDEFVGGSHVILMDNYFIMNQKDSGFFCHTNVRIDPNKELVWDASNIFNAENCPDNIMALSKINNELWIFGNKTIEIWYVTGDSDNEFQRIKSAVLNIGTEAKYSVATNGQTLYWLGSNEQGHGTIFRSNGYQAQPISNHAIEYIIGQLARLDDTVGYCYQQEGHEFYLFSFPSSGKTLCYDATTGLWHERQSFNETSNTSGIHRGISHAMWNGLNYVGDYENGNIYQLDLNTYTDNGTLIQRIRTTPHIHQDRKNIFYNKFEIDMEKAVGIDGQTILPSGLTGNTPQGADPQVILTWSDDGGFTWSKEYWTTIGAIGNYLTRIQWHGLGCSRDRIFRVKITDPVKVVFIGATMDAAIEKG
jgi:hypothetical protein